MKEKVMSLAKEICKGVEHSMYRGLNKAGLARELMDLANIPQDAKISEISRLCDDQVVSQQIKFIYYRRFAAN